MGTSSKLPRTFCSHGSSTSTECSGASWSCLVAFVGELDGGAHLRQPARELLVDGNLAERRRVGVAVVDGGEVEAHVVRGRDEDDARVLVAPIYLIERRVGPCGDGAGVWIAGMGRDRGEDCRHRRAAARPWPACRRSSARALWDRRDKTRRRRRRGRTFCWTAAPVRGAHVLEGRGDSKGNERRHQAKP